MNAHTRHRRKHVRRAIPIARAAPHIDPLLLRSSSESRELQSPFTRVEANLNPLWIITAALAALVVLFFTFG